MPGDGEKDPIILSTRAAYLSPTLLRCLLRGIQTEINEAFVAAMASTIRANVSPGQYFAFDANKRNVYLLKVDKDWQDHLYFVGMSSATKRVYLPDVEKPFLQRMRERLNPM